MNILPGFVIGVCVLMGINLAFQPVKPVPVQPTATVPATTVPPDVLHFIDTQGREHYILANTIIKVERSNWPDGSTIVTCQAPGWQPSVILSADPDAVARAWATAGRHIIDPVTIGVPPP